MTISQTATKPPSRTDSKRRISIRRIALTLVVIYLLLLIVIFFSQRNLLYFPDRQDLKSAVTAAKNVGLEPWEHEGKLIGWKQLSKSAGPHSRVLITHGNAGSAIDRIGYASSLNEVMSCDIYLLEYPGYGPLPGSPTQQSLFRVADEAVSSLEKDGPFFLIGESLGTGVAAYIAGTHARAVTGVLLIAPYHNLGDVAQSHMPIFPARWMILDKFPSATYLSNYQGPLAVLLGEGDITVPPRFGRKLYDEYRGPKKLWDSPLSSHNDLPNQPKKFWQEVFELWKNPN